MNKTNYAYNIFSKLTFEKLPVGKVNINPYKDDNPYSPFSWTFADTTLSELEVKESNGVKIVNLKTNNSKLFNTDNVLAQINSNFKTSSFQLEINISVPTFKTNNIFFNIASTGNIGFRFDIKKTRLEIVCNGKTIICNYNFTENVTYNIVISKIGATYFFIIDGMSIGKITSDDFNNNLNHSLQSLTIGASNSGYTSNLQEFNGNISNINIAYGNFIKYTTAFTKYGVNLMSRYNFANYNINSASIYYCDVESVLDPKLTWTLDKPIDNTLDGYYKANNNKFTSLIPNTFTMLFGLQNKVNVDDITLVDFGDYKVKYTFIKLGEPDVIVDANTTSALNFENDIIDKVATTTWTKAGSAVVQNKNKLFGEYSFETKVLGDNINTTSNNVITGGNKPFTIEFYALINQKLGWFTTGYNQASLFSKNKNSGGGDQALYVNFATGGKVGFNRANSVSTPFEVYGKKNIKFNEYNKYTVTYDGAALRTFVNDELDIVVGTANGFIYNTDLPFTFFDQYIPNYASYRIGTKGLLDNVNIFDGKANKVRNIDPYEEYLVCDLSFDGEYNSQVFVDNGRNKPKWEFYASGSSYIRLEQNNIFKNGYTYFNKTYKNNSCIISKDVDLDFGKGDWTIQYEVFKRTDDQFCNYITSAAWDYQSQVDNLYYFAWFGSSYPSMPIMANKVSFFSEALFNNNKTFIDAVNANPYGTPNVFISKKTLQLNKPYKVDAVFKDGILHVFIDGKYDNSIPFTMPINLSPTNIGTALGAVPFSNEAGLNGGLNYFRAYKGVAIFPKQENNLIQLDFDDNLNDNYSNSVWTNNGNATFNKDPNNSIKGSSLALNGTNYLSSDNTSKLNFTENFSVKMDIKKVAENQYPCLFGSGINIWQGGNQNPNMSFHTNNSANFSFNINNVDINNDLWSTAFKNMWYNINLMRDRNNLFYKVNDVVQGAYNLNDYDKPFNFAEGGSAFIGNTGWNVNNSHKFNGFIDNFETKKGDIVNTNITYLHTTTDFSKFVKNETLYMQYPLSNSPINQYTCIFDDSPLVSDFICEVVCFVGKTTTPTQTRLSFRTKDYTYGNSDDNLGYSAYIADDIIRLGMGSNSTTGAWTTIKSASITPYCDNNFHTFKVVANGASIKMYVDDNLLIDETNTQYNIASKIAIRGNSADAVRPTNIKSFKVSQLDGKQIYYKDFKSDIVNGVNKPALHLPLANSNTNIAFTKNLVINNVNTPTYVTINNKRALRSIPNNYITIDSNNILNLGTDSDFLIEYDFMIENYIQSQHVMLMGNGVNYTNNTSFYMSISPSEEAPEWRNRMVFHVRHNNKDYQIRTKNVIPLNEFVNVKLYRKDGLFTLLINGEENNHYPSDNNNVNKKTDLYNIPLNIGASNFYIGAYPIYTSGFLNYISNFKLWIGTNTKPENYSDNKILSVDFKPTNKSYLFKDNYNKSVLHPFNINDRDYQDSKYCCTFNGTNQYIQLGRNDLFNFGMDEFVIQFKVFINDINDMSNKDDVLLSSGSNWESGYVGIGRYRQNNKLTFGAFGSSGYTSNASFVDGYNDIIITRSGNILKMILNGDVTEFSDFNINVNFNAKGNTQIGRAFEDGNAPVTLFKGQIFVIKVLRNTVDLSLLDSDEVVYEMHETFTLTNGNVGDDKVVNFDKALAHDVQLVSDNQSLKMILDNQEYVVPKSTNITNAVLFDGYKGDVKDLRVYDVPFSDKDVFMGSQVINTEYPDLMIYDDDYTMDLNILDIGDYVLRGFIEGYTDRKYRIYNKAQNYIVQEGIEDYEYNGINFDYFDEYEIHDVVNGQRYPLYKHEMVKGYIGGSVNLKNCGVKFVDMKVYCYRNDNSRLIGVYDLNEDGTYTIPNLDVNSFYDIVFKDQNRKIENISSSYRKPKAY